MDIATKKEGQFSNPESLPLSFSCMMQEMCAADWKTLRIIMDDLYQ